MEKIIKQCTQLCQKYQLALVIAGVVLLILGIILNAAILKTLWFLIGIILIAAGVFGFYTTSRTKIE